MRSQRVPYRLTVPIAVLAAVFLALPAAAAPPDGAADGPPDHAPAHGQERADRHEEESGDEPGASGAVRQDQAARQDAQGAQGGRDAEASGKAKPKANQGQNANTQPNENAKANRGQNANAHGGASAEVRQDTQAREHAKGQQGERTRPNEPAGQGEGKPDTAGGDEHAPAGNKGSVKVRSVGTEAHPPAHQPHLDCVVQVDFYGFPGPGADVTFHSHAPTTPTGETLTSATVSFGSDDANPRGNALVGRRVFDLRDSLDGLSYHEQQGYHVKLTVEADGPQGANTKHKVFWVDCAPDDGVLGGGGGNGGGGNGDGGNGGGGNGGGDGDGDVLGGGGENAGGGEQVSSDTTEVLGNQITRRDATAADRSAGPSGGGVLGAGGALGAGGVLGALGQLAQTGLGIAALLGAALLALGGGVAAVRAGRRR